MACVRWIGGGCFSVALIAWLLSVRVNLTPSVPRGLYRLTREAPTRGSLVLACLPQAFATLARTRGYLPTGSCPGDVMPIGKYVEGMPGDTIILRPTGTWINGHLRPHSDVRPFDTQRRRLPTLAIDTVIIGAEMWWLDTPHPKSLGSRYVGLFPTSALRGTLIPIWLFDHTADTARTSR